MKRNNDNLLLTENQKKIIESSTYPVYIKAGAGTAKTEVLVRKIARVLETDSEASLANIAIITFTNKATDEMRSRLAKQIHRSWMANLESENGDIADKLHDQKSMIHICHISTIHSFCEGLLREYGVETGLSLAFDISNFRYNINQIIKSTVSEFYKQSPLKNLSESACGVLIKDLYLENDNKGISIIKNNYGKAEDKHKFIELYNQIVSKIEAEKKEKNVLTSNDLITKASELLANSAIRKKISNRFKYIFIDEFQDTNYSQFILAKALIDSGVNAFLVGDDKQAIYSFRGADLANSLEIEKYIKSKNKTKLSLIENFRSDPKVIDFINSIFQKEIMHNGTSLEFNHKPLKCPNDTAESEDKIIDKVYETGYTDIVRSVCENDTLRGEKIKYSDIAILCRKNHLVDKIGLELKSAGIPAEVIGGRGFYRTKEIIDIAKVINYVVNARDEHKNELEFTDTYLAFIKTTNGDWEQFLTDLLSYSQRSSIESILDYIYETAGLIEYYEKRANYQAIANIMRLKDMSTEVSNEAFTPAMSFCSFLNRCIGSGAEQDEAPVASEYKERGVVSIYTIHKAKGLSFPVVILAHADESLSRAKHLPNIIFEKDTLGISSEISKIPDFDYDYLCNQRTSKMLEEELRVLYVALTRAKHKIILANHTSENGTPELSWTKWCE
jgi:DNA helicase-2/ATP-dependent DNA helicase PcrA